MKHERKVLALSRKGCHRDAFTAGGERGVFDTRTCLSLPRPPADEPDRTEQETSMNARIEKRYSVAKAVSGGRNDLPCDVVAECQPGQPRC